MTPEPNRRPVLTLLISHWLCALGAGLVTTAACSWLFVLPMQLRGQADNPYIGLLVFIAIPAIFFLGLALIPVGMLLARRRIRAGFAAAHDRRTIYKRLAWFFGTMTLVNVLIASQVTYKAVAHMETVRFCGQSCHVMKPEFTAHLNGPHQKVTCVECHVAPGASGWVASKMSGTRQLLEVMLSNHPRPIPAAMETNRLVSSQDTCEHCHSRDAVTPPRLRVIPKFKDDEANTKTQTVLMMFVGGGRTGGIHGEHMGPGVTMRYRASDQKRQTIPWVEYVNTNTGVTRTYSAEGTRPENLDKMGVHTMQCVDCHNRPTHAFDLPEKAIDKAFVSGELSATLPSVKKAALQILQTPYGSDQEAEAKIPAAVASFYRQGQVKADEIEKVGKAVLAIYRRNVFPDLKVGWGTYPDNIGHTDTPGCFRCHDDGHVTAAKKTITQDCGTCHNALAVEEPAPEILKSAGLIGSPASPPTK